MPPNWLDMVGPMFDVLPVVDVVGGVEAVVVVVVVVLVVVVVGGGQGMDWTQTA